MTSTIVDFPKENSSLNERLNALEDFYVNNVLSEELKETFFDIRKECKEFKEGLFNPNVELIENDIFIINVVGNVRCWGKENVLKGKNR